MGRYSCTRRRGILSGPRLHVHRTMGQPVRRLGSVQKANEVNAAHAELEVFASKQQGKKFIREVIEALPAMQARPDKRRRPKGVSKEVFRAYRKLKLK